MEGRGVEGGARRREVVEGGEDQQEAGHDEDELEQRGKKEEEISCIEADEDYAWGGRKDQRLEEVGGDGVPVVGVVDSMHLRPMTASFCSDLDHDFMRTGAEEEEEESI